MRTGDGLWRAGAAVGALAAGILFSLPGGAFARLAHIRAEAAAGQAPTESVRPLPAMGASGADDVSTDCGKCHSSCEDGASHASLAPIAARGGGLPLDAQGRVDCVTCHRPHRDGAGADTSARLRLPLLRRELCLACHCQEGESPSIEIISPLERAVVQEDHLALIGRAARLPDDLLTVRLNGSTFYLHAKGGRFFTWLTLQDGVNTIEIAQDGRVLWVGEVFHGQGALGGYGRASSSHGTANREECLGCHFKPDGVSAATMGATPGLCYGCHDRFEGKRYVHGPLAVGDCLACHDPHGGLGSSHLRQEAGLLCRNCHPARGNSPQQVCDTAGKGCVDCHDPHQSDTRYLLRGPRYTMRGDIPALR